MAETDGYRLEERPAEPEDYVRLREIAGLEPRSVEAARAGLPNSLYAVRIVHDGRVVGMGRVVGDGGACYQIVDVAVDPEHQDQGLGKRVVAAMMDYLRANAPKTAYVSLMADGDATELYAQFGFEPTEPRSTGMSLIL